MSYELLEAAFPLSVIPRLTRDPLNNAVRFWRGLRVKPAMTGGQLITHNS
jgi:hypothetical protein